METIYISYIIRVINSLGHLNIIDCSNVLPNIYPLGAKGEEVITMIIVIVCS